MRRLLPPLLMVLLATPAAARQHSVDVRVLPAGGPVSTAGDTLRFDRFEDALRNGRFDKPDGLPPDVGRLVDALQALLGGDRASALAGFEALGTASDEGVRGVATQGRLELLFEAGRWSELAKAIAAAGGEAPPIVAGMLASGPMEVGAAPVVADRLTVSERGQAQLDGEANGRSLPLYFDTGAAITTLRDSVASAIGVEYRWEGVISVSTATSQERPARLGVIRELRIGALVVRNLPVFVFPDEDLRFALASGDTVTIDAILGWDVIRRSHAVLDFGAGRYSLELADAAPPDGDPLVWSGYPIVRLHAAGGAPLLFGLDTGSFNTSITDNVLTKLDVGAVTADTIPIGGVGGFVDTPVRVAERVTLRIADHFVELGGAWTEEDGGADEVFFFRIDGVLGIDIAQGCRLTVHGPGGFDLRCPPG